MERDVTAFFLGRERDVSRRFLGLALAIGLAAATSASFGHYVAPAVLGVVGRVLMVLVPICCLLAGVQAYRNRGLVVSLALVFAPLFGMIAHGFGIAVFSEPTPPEWFGLGVRIGGGLALVLGTLLFLAGAGARTIADRLGGTY